MLDGVDGSNAQADHRAEERYGQDRGASLVSQGMMEDGEADEPAIPENATAVRRSPAEGRPRRWGGLLWAALTVSLGAAASAAIHHTLQTERTWGMVTAAFLSPVWPFWLVLLGAWRMAGRKTCQQVSDEEAWTTAEFRSVLATEMKALRKRQALGVALLLALGGFAFAEMRGLSFVPLMQGVIGLGLSFELACWLGVLLGCRAKGRGQALLAAVCGFLPLIAIASFGGGFPGQGFFLLLTIVGALYLVAVVGPLLTIGLMVTAYFLGAGSLLAAVLVIGSVSGPAPEWEPGLLVGLATVWVILGLLLWGNRFLTQWAGGHWLGRVKGSKWILEGRPMMNPTADPY